MAAGANRKKTRSKKTSQGVHGAGGKVKLTVLEKALLGGGVIRQSKPLQPITPWLGASDSGAPADPVQAAKNRELLPHLFPAGRR